MSSHYSRREVDGSTIFSVTPAPYPGAGQGKIVFWGGVFAIVAGIPLLIILVGAFFILIGIMLVLAGLKLKKKHAEEAASRVPFDITVSNEGIFAGGVTYKAADIAELLVTHQNAGPSTVHYQDVSTASARVGAAYAENIANAQSYVGYQASARLRSDSRPAILAAGLSQQTASSLVRDLSEALAA